MHSCDAPQRSDGESWGASNGEPNERSHPNPDALPSRKQAKEEIRGQYGSSKLREYTPAQIKALAGMWIELHWDELFVDAKRMIASSPELQRMEAREQRARAKLRSDAQTNTQPKSTTSAVQMSGAK